MPGAVLGEGHVSLLVAGAVLGEGCYFSWQAQYLVKVQCHFSWQAQYLVKFKCHFSWQAVLGEGQVGQVSVFVAGAVLGEIWKDSRIAKCYIFQYKMLVLRTDGNGPGSCSDRPRIGNDVSAVLRKFLPDVGWSLCVAGAILREVQVSLFVADAVLGEGQVSLFVAGAVLGEGHVSLFVAGAILGEGQVSLFVAGTVLGKGHVSLFVAGAVYLVKVQCYFYVAGAELGEIWKDSRSAKCFFYYKTSVARRVAD